MSRAVHQEIANRIEKTAIEKGILRGTYSLGFGRSLINEPDLEANAADFVFEYLEETLTCDRAPLKRLHSTDSVRCIAIIVKHNANGARLSAAHHPISAWSGECQQEAQRLVEERVESKVRKLAGIKIPRVLLLWDASSLLTLEDLRSVSCSDSWHVAVAAAFVVHEHGDVLELWSSITDWDGSGGAL